MPCLVQRPHHRLELLDLPAGLVLAAYLLSGAKNPMVL